eukprot:7094933-Prymnesium_polylepis.1
MVFFNTQPASLGGEVEDHTSTNELSNAPVLTLYAWMCAARAPRITSVNLVSLHLSVMADDVAARGRERSSKARPARQPRVLRTEYISGSRPYPSRPRCGTCRSRPPRTRPPGGRGCCEKSPSRSA